MFKFFLFFIILTSFLNGDDKVEIYATTMDTKDNIVKAHGEVVVIYQDYHLSAQRAIYNKNSGELELFENIHATKGNNIKLLGSYAKLNIAKKERTFRPFYMVEQTSNVWISGAKSFANDVKVEIDSGVMSGCDPNDPLWKMEFSSSDYNTDTMWLNLYNAKFYIYDIPVFYTPYFGYSLDTTRRTGFLTPMIGFSKNEGFYYEQTFYIAEQNWWDLELKPQIRTNRGAGIYANFRFVDSNASKGNLTTGYFKEKSKYLSKNSLANNKHYGFNFNYQNNDLLNEWFNLNLNGQSQLYVDIHNMNDVEYINLSSNDITKNATATQLLSRINLFYNKDSDYIGAYFKYYKDLTLDSNKKTLQTIPSIQYHRYLDTFLDNHFLYSLDIKSNNYYRSIGKNAVQTDINIPLSFQTSLFEEYINISYKLNNYAQHTSFSGDEEIPTSNEYNNGFFARNYHILSASSQQTKAYDEFTHVVDFGALYTVGGAETRDGYYKEQKDYCSLEINKDQAICEFYNISDIEENLQLYFSQYFYDNLGKQMIYHRLSQNFSYEDINGGAGELENELDYKITDTIGFYNNMFYNYDKNSFSKNFNQISYNSSNFNIALSHMYEDTFFSTTQNTNYITSSVGYKYNNHYSYNFKYHYNLETDEKKSVELGFLYQKRCWDFGITYLENNKPILNESGISDSIYEKYILFTIRFKPIMSSSGKMSGFAFRLPDSSEGN
jgi:LPS-assembly protein